MATEAVIFCHVSGYSSLNDASRFGYCGQTGSSDFLSFLLVSLFSHVSPLQPNLYPTVGLQTPGEVVDANFGQHPFVFDIEDYMREWRTKIQAQIDHFPIGEREGEWQSMIQK